MVRVGIDIGGTKIAILSECQGERHFSVVPTDLNNPIAQIEALVDGAASGAHAIGVAIPGLVTDGRVIASDVVPALDGWCPAETWPQAAVAVVNDAVAALTAFPQGENVAMIMAGTAIGSAFRSQGQLVRGAKGWGCELGSLPLCHDPDLITLDNVAGGAAILAALGCDAREVHFRLQRRDPQTLSVVRRAGSALGAGIATLINLIAPEQLYIGGGTLSYETYTTAAIEVASRLSLPLFWGECVLSVLPPGSHPVASGALSLASSALESP